MGDTSSLEHKLLDNFTMLILPTSISGTVVIRFERQPHDRDGLGSRPTISMAMRELGFLRDEILVVHVRI